MIFKDDGFRFGTYDNLSNIEKNTSDYIGYMLNRTQQMFSYGNLPESIPHRFLELYTQSYGKSCIAEHNGKMYVFFGAFSELPNEYYIPTKFVVSNPYLKLEKEFTIDSDCVIMANDSLYKGLMPLAENYASRLVDADISLRMAAIMLRVTAGIITESDADKKAAERFLKNLERGKLSHLSTSAGIIKKIGSIAFDNGERTITQLIEYRQYCKASWYNDLGVNANYNMKREAVNSNEAEMDNDSLLPLCDDMFNCRKEAVDKINNMFSHLLEKPITVDFSSAWKKMREANRLEIKMLENEVKSNQLDKGDESREIE